MINKLSLAVLLLIVVSCKQKKTDIYNLENYELATKDTNYSQNGFRPAKMYLYKYDSKRKYRIYYWANGNEMAKGFSYAGEFDGFWQHFDNSGCLFKSGKFFRGIKIDTHRLYYANGSVKKETIFPPYQ